MKQIIFINAKHVKSMRSYNIKLSYYLYKKYMYTVIILYALYSLIESIN